MGTIVSVLVTKLIILWRARLMPIASAAISSSRIALSARPYDERIMSTIISMHTTANRKYGMTSENFSNTVPSSTDLKVLSLESGKEPLVSGPSLSHTIIVRTISAKPRVAIAR